MLRPQYLAPSNPKPKKTKIVLLVVFLFVSITLGMYYVWKTYFQEDQPKLEYHTICNYSIDQTVELLKNRLDYPDVLIEDIFFYGESLNFKQEKHQVGMGDSLNGKTMTLVNLCNNQQYSFLNSSQLDINILTYTLPNGFYEVLVEDNFIFHHLSTPQKQTLDFYTITRNQTSQYLNIFSDAKYFIDPETEEVIFKQNRLFIEVSSQTSPYLDIMIDAVGYDQDFNHPNTGIIIDEDFNTAQKSYQMALDLQAKLQELGLKVALTRPQAEIFVNTYGEKGRVHQAIDQRAKLMLQLDFAQIENATNRNFMVTSSNYASRSLGTLLADSILQNSQLKYETQRGFIGSILPSTLNKLDRQNLIRESGGIALGAGLYSDLSSRLNEFARTNPYGVQSVSISFGNMKNQAQRENFEDEYDVIIDKIVQALSQYLRIV